MATERRETIRTLAHLPLLQSGELGSASPIREPELLPPETLNDLWDLGALATTTKYVAVAYAQFSPRVFEEAGIPALRNAMFIKQNPLPNAPHLTGLFLNPSLTDIGVRQCLTAEGCGSIAHGTIYMMLLRPARARLRAYWWEPGLDTPVPVTHQLPLETAFLFEHEIDHLHGQDATSFPKRFVDFPKILSDRRILDAHGILWTKEVKEEVAYLVEATRRNGNQPWLVYRKGRFVEVTEKGKVIQVFRR